MSAYSVYRPEGFALEIFKQRYALHPDETFSEACDRVAAYVASAESEVVKFRSEFSNLLKTNLFMPAGRIWYGSGRPKGQLLNCFVAPTVDSREGWGKTFYDETVICGTGGGLGLNFSPIRPRGSLIAGHKGPASGAVSLMECVDLIGERLKAGGGRRTALMLALSMSHGDIEEFIDKKIDLKQLTNANVSVIFDENPETFFIRVREDEVVDLKFGTKIVGKLRAKDIWSKIVRNAITTGEPGILNGYLANRMSNVWYQTPLICTNPCGEIWLSAYDCCCLGALVLPRFVRSNEIDWDALHHAIVSAVRFLDNVLTVNNYPLPEIKETCHTLRRIGLGVMGLHDLLLALGLRYSSGEGLEIVDRVMSFVKESAYQASIELAQEKGPFPAFDSDKLLQSGFAKTLRPVVRDRIRKYGLRNCALLTIAPTGTTSLVCDTTSGIEPMFAPAHIRRYRNGGDGLKEETVIHPLFKSFLVNGKNTDHFEGAYDLSLQDHFEMQRVCQRHIDNACAKTINIPVGSSEKDLSDAYMKFLPDLKGVTVYPNGARADQPLVPLSLSDAVVVAEKQKTTTYAQAQCASGECEL